MQKIMKSNDEIDTYILLKYGKPVHEYSINWLDRLPSDFIEVLYKRIFTDSEHSLNKNKSKETKIGEISFVLCMNLDEVYRGYSKPTTLISIHELLREYHRNE